MLQFPIAMTPRTEPARALAWLSPVIAFALTVFTGFCLFAALGQDPVKALGVFFIAPLDSLRGWTEIAVKMTPLLLCAAGLVVCFKANVWNIGAEGQLIAGAITGGVVALACDPSWGRWYVVLVMLASAVGGAVWGGFTALLRHRFHANEILVSLMLVYVAQFLLAWCVQGPMRDPMGFGFPQTKLFEAGDAAGARGNSSPCRCAISALFGGRRMAPDGSHGARLSVQGLRHGALCCALCGLPSGQTHLGIHAHLRSACGSGWRH